MPARCAQGTTRCNASGIAMSEPVACVRSTTNVPMSSMAVGSMGALAGEAFSLFMHPAKPPGSAASSVCGSDEVILWEELQANVPRAPRIGL